MSYIFIGGVQRSGTYLVQSILCADEATNPMLAEAKHLRMLLSTYYSSRTNFEKLGRDYFDDPSDLRRFTAGYIGEYLARIGRRFPDARHIVLKDPNMTPLFPDLHELVEDCRFLIMVRDPRDVVASLIEVGERQSAERVSTVNRDGAPDPTARAAARDIGELMRYVVAFYARCIDRPPEAFRRRTLFVKYETLVGDPPTAIAAIRRHTGLALAGFDPGADWSAGVRAVFSDDARRLWGGDLYGKAISAAHVGRYRTDLSAEEIAAVERLGAPLFEVFGYPRHTAAGGGEGAAR